MDTIFKTIRSHSEPDEVGDQRVMNWLQPKLDEGYEVQSHSSFPTDNGSTFFFTFVLVKRKVWTTS